MHASTQLPKHIAIVMDGNGRWATQRHLPRKAGHQAGAKAAENAITFCAEKKIPALTLFAFSSENWSRPRAEVNFLMELFLKTLQQKTKKLHENKVRLRFMGDISQFTVKLQQMIAKAEQLTAENNGLQLTIAVNYSGRWDITQAMQKIAQQIQTENLLPENIHAQTIQQALCLADLPEPDLFIRTSGEIRISNFMLWQLAYTELYFTDVLWPDFSKANFEKALEIYAQRQRRFGLTAEQVEDATV